MKNDFYNEYARPSRLMVIEMLECMGYLVGGIELMVRVRIGLILGGYN